MVQEKHLTISGIAGKENPADTFTKLTPMASIINWKKKHMGNGHQTNCWVNGYNMRKTGDSEWGRVLEVLYTPRIN